MPGETITLQVGQCGNQVGLQYWQQLAQEHEINSDGTQLTINKASEHPELFFTVSDTNKYTPRSILIDLEPSVISKSLNTLPMFNQRNIHLSEHSGGAGNNFINGYKYGNEHTEEITNLIDREMDKCDNLSQFQLFHSVAGGTGSGCGSKILEILSDRYTSKKLITTTSIFPSNDKTSDVVVQPYNSVLTLQKLIEFSNATFVFHNDALNNIENSITQTTSDSYQGTNKLIANIMASTSNPLRFPGYMYSSIESIISNLVPTPDLKFLTTSIAPFKTNNEYDMFLELSNDKYKSIIPSSDASYISLMNYLISGQDLDRKEIRKGILKIQQRTKFVPWTSRSIAVVHGKKPNSFLEGIQISNNTSIADTFSKILNQYDLLVKRKAYLNTYTENNSIEELDRIVDIFNQAKEDIVKVIQTYRDCSSIDYLD
ncbi:TUB4 [Candida pseudojiufengensis]|uniref:TUB4 n=1 Tax=Candida pseudojiufengensis TaxID=497109 RepID=UPI002225AB42|nr:TUB4 [Candida pseudojiufengensis]KAI5965942.1 TUB4 [Candida pseudojiufengensis]